MNENPNRRMIETGGGNLCFDELVGGDSCFDIEELMGYLLSDEESSKKMDLEGSSFVMVSGVGVGNNFEETRNLTEENSVVGDCSATDQCGIGDLCIDDFDINWLVQCLNSDKQEFGGGLCLDNLSGGGSDDFDMVWFMKCLNSDKDKEVEPFEDNSMSKVVKRNVMIGYKELEELGGGFYLDEVSDFDVDWLLRIMGSNQEEQLIQDTACNNIEKRGYEAEFEEDLCFDEVNGFDVNWFMRIMDSNQQEQLIQDTASNTIEKRGYEAEFGRDYCPDDLGEFNVDWFMRILDSNHQEEPVEQPIISKLSKRKFESEKNSNQTKKMRFL